MIKDIKTFSVPDLCDLHENKINIGDIFLRSFGGCKNFYGQIRTAECSHSNVIVKELVQEDGTNKVLVIKHTGTDLCSMVGDQIAAMAYKNNWSGIFVDGYIRDVEIIQDIEIGVYAKNAYPKKTDKSIGIGIKDSRFKIGTVDVSSGSWIYVDTNGWLVSNEELEF